MNILITNVGRRGYLAEYIKALPQFRGKVFTSDCDITASGLYGENDGHFLLPRPTDDEKGYVDEMIRLCAENGIDAVLPVIDPEIYILSKYRESFREHGIFAVVSDPGVLEICYDKLKMNDFLDEIGLAHPRTYETAASFEQALAAQEVSFPVVIKPVLGSGSVDTYFVDSIERVRILFRPGMIIQEKLSGTEYGTDTFNSFEGKPLRCVIKKKISMRSGETDKSVSVHNGTIRSALLLLAEKLGHIANLDCDVILCGDTPYIIDMNPRFGGGYPATHAIGVNLVDLLCRMLCGEQIPPDHGEYPDDVLVMKEIAIRSTVIHGFSG